MQCVWVCEEGVETGPVRAWLRRCEGVGGHRVIYAYQNMRVLPAGAWERGGADAGRSSLGPLDCVPPCPSAVQTSVEQDSDMRRPQAALLVMMAGALHVLPRVWTRR